MRKSIFLAVSLLMAFTMILAACAPAAAPVVGNSAAQPAAGKAQPAADQAKPTDKPAEKPAASGGAKTKLTYLIWSDDVSKDTNWQEEMKLFNSTHKDIEVTLVGAPCGEFTAKLQAMIAAGTPPDVVNVMSMGEYVSKGFLAPLDELMKRDGVDASNFLPGAEQPAYDGKYYGFRHDLAYWLLFYNKDMFDKAGVAYPPATGWTVQEYEDAACKLSNAKASQWGSNNLNWLTNFIIMQRGGKVFDTVNGVPQYVVDNKTALDTYQELGDFINVKNCQINKDQSDSIGGGNAFASGNTAMTFDGNWALGYIGDTLKFKYGVAPIPGLKQPYMGMYVGMTAAGKNQEAAWTFVKWLMAEPDGPRFRAKAGMGQPAISDKEALDTFLNNPKNPPEFKQVFDVITKAENVLPALPELPGQSAADGKLNPAIDEVWFGTGKAADVIPPAVKDANSVLSEEWNKIKK